MQDVIFKINKTNFRLLQFKNTVRVGRTCTSHILCQSEFYIWFSYLIFQPGCFWIVRTDRNPDSGIVASTLVPRAHGPIGGVARAGAEIALAPAQSFGRQKGRAGFRRLSPGHQVVQQSLRLVAVEVQLARSRRKLPENRIYFFFIFEELFIGHSILHVSTLATFLFAELQSTVGSMSFQN